MAGLPVPNPATAVPGEFLTSALWNAQVRDAVSYLIAPPSFRATATVTFSIPDNAVTAWTSLPLDTEQFDNYGGHSTTTNTSRYTCQIAGIYSVTGTATFANNATGNRGVRIAVNGAAVGGSFVKTLPANNGSTGLVTAALVALNVGDFVEVQANQNSGASLATAFAGPDVNPALSVLWVSN